MGIAQFFVWFRKNFSTSIYNLNNNQTLSDINIDIDNLLIDMNGLFHNSAQKVYEYGNFKRGPRFININKPPKSHIDVFIDVCKNIEDIFQTVKPRKRLILAVDGPAPKCKLNQQRQRRYRSALDREEDDTSFDSNCISPGTKFMDGMGRYIDWYIKKRMSEDQAWQKIEVIFSNEKAPSEGEQKAFSFIRKYGSKTESYLIHGNDADLLMLSLVSHIDNFYVLRDDTAFNKPKDAKFLCVNIGHVYLQLQEIMSWASILDDGFTNQKEVIPCSLINDFVFLCFTLGNDFLPHIPGIEIIEGGIDTILSVYRDVCKFNGHITKVTSDGKIYFNKIPLKIFFQVISEYEKPVLEHKLQNKKIYFQDKLLESCATFKENVYELDIKKYRNEYCKLYFGSTKNSVLEKICHSYLEGLQFVISYYTNNVPSWNWNYPNYYAPSTYLLAQYIDTFTFNKYEKSTPLLPFQQLMYILPPKSFNLLPTPLESLHGHEDLEDFYPDKVDIDLAGKKNDWQGIVILPVGNLDTVKKVHNEHTHLVDNHEIKRNTIGRTFKYTYITYYNSTTYKSYFGDITNYKLRTTLIDI
jgi:5'-3' exonuclease